jgi:hypothetical protein
MARMAARWRGIRKELLVLRVSCVSLRSRAVSFGQGVASVCIHRQPHAMGPDASRL